MTEKHRSTRFLRSTESTPIQRATPGHQPKDGADTLTWFCRGR
jgi:hypothetical protein